MHSGKSHQRKFPHGKFCKLSVLSVAKPSHTVKWTQSTAFPLACLHTLGLPAVGLVWAEPCWATTS